MVTNKDFDDLAKKADNGLHGLGKIVNAVAKLSQEGTRQQRKMVFLAIWSITLTVIILIFTILSFFNISFYVKPEKNNIRPKSHTNNIENTIISTNKINKNKTKTD